MTMVIRPTVTQNSLPNRRFILAAPALPYLWRIFKAEQNKYRFIPSLSITPRQVAKFHPFAFPLTEHFNPLEPGLDAVSPLDIEGLIPAADIPTYHIVEIGSQFKSFTLTEGYAPPNWGNCHTRHST
uniref:Nfu_N domain-containing protein n=1 Tax=Mesocestoides corti TaxID=53468 RepID=A0A5K3EMU9_MESCO